MSAPDIFLSYNREDATVAKTYADAFTAAGLEVWWDQTLKSGEAYDKVTEAALRGAKAVVVLWSPRSVDSRWVRAEATIAERKGTLMPVSIEPCERPVMFELTQTAELSHWRGDMKDRAWLDFLGDVRRKAGRDEPGPTAPVTAQAPASGGRGAPSVVAVLPIAHRAGDEDMELLAEDLTEDLTRFLARNQYFEVIAAGTVAAWRGRAIDHRALGQELDARYLVEGKVQRTGGEARLTLQLIDTESGRMLWSQRTSRKLADLSAASDDFAFMISVQLGENIIQIEISRAMTKGEACTAWDHLLRALAYVGRGGMDNVSAIIEESRKAVAAAPDLATAHAMLAVALGQQIHTGIKELDEELKGEIRLHLTRAMQLGGNDLDILTMIVAGHNAIGDSEAALRLARRSVELDPNSIASYDMLGVAYVGLGRLADAIAMFTQQERLSSNFGSHFGGLAWLGLCHLLEGRPEVAEEALDRALALRPDFNFALTFKALVEAYLGKQQAALATVRRLREAEPMKTFDQYERMLNRIEPLRPRMAEHIANLRRLWEATEPGE